MRLNLKPWSTLKALAATTSVFTMCMAPVAQGAQAANQKQLINQFLKDTELSTKRQTVGEYWQRVRHVYPEKLQGQLDEWVKYNRNELMPTVEATTYKGADGSEQVRLNLTMGPGKTMTLAFTGDEDQPLKVNTVTLSKKELSDYNKFDAVVSHLAKDPAIKKSLEVPVEKSVTTASNKKFLKGHDLAQLPIRTQAEYLMRMRLAVDAADRVLDLAPKAKKGASNDLINEDAVSYVWNMLLTPANAAGMLSCVASGWIASYYDGSCARPNPGRETLLRQAQQLPFNDSIKSKVSSCASGGGLPCNPMIFGFQDNSGTPYCITSDLKSATNQCDKKAPLPSSKERIIQSIVAAKGKDSSLCKLNGEKTVSEDCSKALDNYTASLQSHYLNAASFCTNNGVANIESRSSWQTRSDIRGDQIDACENLKNRFFDLQVALTPPPVVAIDDCEKVADGSHKDQSGKCVCSDGSAPKPGTGGVDKSSHGKAPTSSKKPASVSDSDMAAPKPGASSVQASSAGPKLTCAGVGDTSGKLPPEKEQCSEWSWCKKKGLYIAAGFALLGLGLFFLLFKKHKKKSNKKDYEPPAPAPSPSATATTSPVVVNPEPNPNPCVAPNTMVNNVCTPPTIVVPDPPAATTEGGTATGTILNGGTR